MNDFYVNLPSNTPGTNQYSRENTTSQFRVRLPEEIRLGNEQWEVALVELQYPFSWNNIVDDYTETGNPALIHSAIKQCEMEVIFLDGTQLCVSIPPGYYKDADALIAVIQKRLESRTRILSSQATMVVSPYFYFDMDYTRQKVVFTRNSKQEKEVYVYLSPLLQYVLGFESPKLTSNRVVAKYPPDLRAGCDSLYIYCDLIEPQLVGNKREQLLRIVPVSGSYGEIVDRVFVAPHYVPVLNRQFSTIEIAIKTDRNVPFAFLFGKTIVKLHFRKSRGFRL